jgi:hypothetical protein
MTGAIETCHPYRWIWVKYKEAVREDKMRKYLFALILFFVLVVPHVAVADDYPSGVESSLILKTTTTTGHYPAKYLNIERPKITVMKVEIKPGDETGWHSHPVPLMHMFWKGT